MTASDTTSDAQDVETTSSQRFTPRAVLSCDYADGVKYSAAAMGAISPGDIAAEVLGTSISFGRLFAYLYRRFGPPNMGSDEYKEIARYLLTTPMKDVFLYISIKATNGTDLLFGYVMPRTLDHQLMLEENGFVKNFHTEFHAWRVANDRLLPRDKSDTYDTREDSKAFDEYMQAFCADGGTHIDHLPKGPKTLEVMEAIRATLKNLKSPVGVRDTSFSAVGDDSEEDEEGGESDGADCHASAGYPVPPEYMKDPKLFVALSKKLIELGGGDLEAGLKKFVAPDSHA